MCEHQIEEYEKFEAAREISASYVNRFIDFADVGEESSQGWMQRVRHPWISTRRRSYADILKDQSVFTITSIENQVEDILLRIKNLTAIRYREKLYSRLLDLRNHLVEDEENMNVGSLRSFCHFLRHHPGLKYPSITLSQENNINLSWEINMDKLFNICFLSNNDVRFVIFTPNQDEPSHVDRIYGSTKLDTVIKFADRQGVMEWITE